MTPATPKTPTPTTPTIDASRFPGWTWHHTGGGCAALLRVLPGGCHVLLTEPGHGGQEPTDPHAPICMGVYTSGQFELEGCALFNCRSLMHAEDILGALTLIGETAIGADADPNDCAEPGVGSC